MRRHVLTVPPCAQGPRESRGAVSRLRVRFPSFTCAQRVLAARQPVSPVCAAFDSRLATDLRAEFRELAPVDWFGETAKAARKDWAAKVLENYCPDPDVPQCLDAFSRLKWRKTDT